MGLNKDAFEFKDETPVGMRRSHNRRKHLSLNEKVEIIYKVLVQHEKIQDVAKEHRIKANHVSFLSRRASKNPTFLRELFSADDVK